MHSPNVGECILVSHALIVTSLMKTLIRFLAFCIISTPAMAEGIDPGAAVQLMANVQSRCQQYAFHGEVFWRGHIKEADEAPGLVTLNEVIQHSVKRARSAEEAREIAWQKCLDFVFNNQNSRGYRK